MIRVPAPIHRIASRRAALLVLAAIAAALLSACGGSARRGVSLPATHGDPESVFTAGAPLDNDPAGTLAELKRLGVDRVRVFVGWGEVAPHPDASREPSFDAADPAAYPAANWSTTDAIVRDAKADHIALDVLIGGSPPLWASGPGRPAPTHGDPHPYWKPSPTEFGQFVTAVGTRYSGHYIPPGASRPLPRVGFWSIWNEPNLGTYLAPEMTHSYSSVEVAPRLYRGLVDAAWTALHATGHGRDTILFGELGPAGSTAAGAPGLYAAMPPLEFLRALYCVNAGDQLRGLQASARGCPTTAAGSARFTAQNPALFKATGFAMHPYSFYKLPPAERIPDSPGYINLAAISTLETTLDRLQRVYGSPTTFPIWSTEYGYITNPPNVHTGVSPTVAAEYLNWAEYISWKNPRIRSYDQYLVTDPPLTNPPAKQPFATGLETSTGVAKPAYAAYRMPIFLPTTSTTKGSPLEVWGCVRPAKTVATTKRAPAQIQWRAGSSGPWKTIAAVSTRTRYGYFDVRVTFPGSGSVRVSWSAPHGPAIASRTVAITMH